MTTARVVIDSRTPGTDWALYCEAAVETAEQDPNEIALAEAVRHGVPPGSGAVIAYNATVRFRVWLDGSPLDGDPDGEYAYDATAVFRESVAAAWRPAFALSASTVAGHPDPDAEEMHRELRKL